MRLKQLSGVAAIALLAMMGTASAAVVVTGSIFTGTTPPAGFDNFGPGTANSRQAQGTPFQFGSETITWTGGSPLSGLFAGSASGFTSPFGPLATTQQYLVAGGGGGSVTVADAVGQGDTLSLIWGTVDTEAGRNLLVTAGGTSATVTGAQALAACGGVAGTSNCIITIAGLGNWTSFTVSDSSSAAFEFDPPTQVPEPASLAIFGAALAGLGLIRRRRNRNAA